MQRKPPFRADHVGSLLRPAALREAREKRARGEIDAAALTAIEDDEIRKLIAKQEAVGLKSITDGEFRRASWQTDFLQALDGIETFLGDRKIQFKGGPQPKQWVSRVKEKLGRFSGHPQIAHWRFVADHTKADREGHDPLPVRAAFPPGPRRRAGGDLSRHGGLLSRPRRALRQGGARLRRRRLPLSAARRSQPRLSVRSRRCAST